MELKGLLAVTSNLGHGCMGAAPSVWALTQEAGEWSQRVKGLTNLPLTSHVTYVSYWALADLCFPVSETGSHYPYHVLLLLRGNKTTDLEYFT